MPEELKLLPCPACEYDVQKRHKNIVRGINIRLAARNRKVTCRKQKRNSSSHNKPENVNNVDFNFAGYIAVGVVIMIIAILIDFSISFIANIFIELRKTQTQWIN